MLRSALIAVYARLRENHPSLPAILEKSARQSPLLLQTHYGEVVKAAEKIMRMQQFAYEKTHLHHCQTLGIIPFNYSPLDQP
jgi:hypothetical protein